MFKSLLQKYVLPKEVDFLGALNLHAQAIKRITHDLQSCFIEGNEACCQAVMEDEHQAKSIKESNMNELLNSFITPIDRESIFRVISQLDWLAISIRHFIIEAKAYEVLELHNSYNEIFSRICQSADHLANGFEMLVEKRHPEVADEAQNVRDCYNSLVDVYVEKMASLSKSNNLQEMFIHRELLLQLKEIGKRFQVCANSLEDILVKMS
ncbi:MULTISPECIES: DUF47 domain-containing protein [Thiomicrorhabdus]|uniref:DUF47 family protein n=1 Tax=Thiomicrorhabdus heinhorstiae TaxID=2748010 RepID=A0ABS0BYI5_9GAMM|nr:MULTISPECIES: DUF47 family protein [Thiomicrorhabdus]MBF6058857.1 DUF47 family protein [Thiomicrorhabdus heinhorstiae]